MPETIADLLRRTRRSSLLGRDQELLWLKQMLTPGGPVVAYVHGPVGMGKTALLDAFETSLSDSGTRVARLLAGATEPLAGSIIAALANRLGAVAATISELADLLGTMPGLIVVLVDDVDTWRLALSWLRTELVPRLPENVRFVLAGRAAPPSQWIAEYGSYFLDIRLQPLSRMANAAIVSAAGLPPQAAERIWQLTAGHPLGLRMAIHLAATDALDTVHDAGELANAILIAVDDAELRRAVEACAVVRRASRSLLQLLLGANEPVAVSLVEAIEALPFARRDAEGVFIVEPVRRAIIDWLAGVDAERYQHWRSRAAGWFIARLRSASRGGRWRHMADLLDLLEEPSLRNAFFPTDAAAPPVEPARPEDMEQILSLVQDRAGSDERDRIASWAEFLPHRFAVARGADDDVLAFCVYARQDDPLAELVRRDPLFAVWAKHLADHPAGGEVLFVRQVLARSPDARTACILDLKRSYIERPELSRIYCYSGLEDVGLLFRLGFRPLETGITDLPTMMLEVPCGNIVDWVSALVEAEPSNEVSGNALVFVRDRREITVNGQVVELTPLEAQVLARLIDRAPAVVGREEFIEHIWQRTYVGSNVVDTVVRSLRKKLGPLSSSIQTVPKAGYRYLEKSEDDAGQD